MDLHLATRDKMCIFVILVITTFTGAIGQDTACSAANRENNLSGCLDAIRQIAQNNSNFWYGSEAVAKCSAPELKYTINCFNLHEGVKTLSELAFGAEGTDLSTIDRFVDVKYTSTPGSYVGCDYNFEQDTTTNFSLDPLSSMAYTPWDLRTTPEITWEANPSDLYTLVVIDAGHGWLHGLFVNIPGSNFSQAEAVKTYHGPRNTREIPNTYAFVLFKQSSQILASSIFLPPFTPFNITMANTAYQFGELVGLTWFLASYDAYAMKLQEFLGVRQNCASLVGKAYQSHTRRPFLPDTLNLSVFLRLRITQDAGTYPCGEETVSMPATDFYVDPIGNPIINTYDARAESTRTFSMQMNKMFPNNTVDFIGKQYSMVVVDPDIPSIGASLGTNDRPLLHGLTINIQGNDFSSGTVVRPYRGPGPPNPARHVYYFLLYEQPGTLNLVDVIASHANGCPTNVRLMGRCLFDVEAFTAQNNLSLAGATWISATNDKFIQCRTTTTQITNDDDSAASAALPNCVMLCLLIFITKYINK